MPLVDTEGAGSEARQTRVGRHSRSHWPRLSGCLCERRKSRLGWWEPHPSISGWGAALAEFPEQALRSELLPVRG